MANPSLNTILNSLLGRPVSGRPSGARSQGALREPGLRAPFGSPNFTPASTCCAPTLIPLFGGPHPMRRGPLGGPGALKLIVTRLRITVEYCIYKHSITVEYCIYLVLRPFLLLSIGCCAPIYADWVTI
jgi:hypothetical protein